MARTSSSLPRRKDADLGLRLQRLRLLGGSFTAVAVVFLLFAELFLFGGDRLQVGLFFAAAELIGLGLLLLFVPWTRAALARAGYLLGPGLAFLVVLVWGTVQILPLPWALPEHTWAYVEGRQQISIDTFRTLTELLKLSGLAALTLIGVAIGQDDDRAHVTWNAIGLCGAVYIGWILFAHFEPILAGRPPQKLVATLGGPNAAATLLSILAVVSWTAILRAAVSLTHQSFSGDRLTAVATSAAPWGVLLLLSLGALSLTGSRGGAGACFVGLLASTFTMVSGEFRNRRALILICAATGLAILCFAALVMSSGVTAARLSQVDGALANRREIISIYLGQLPELPWTGFGLGAFRHFNNLLIAPGQNEVLWDLGAMHNVVLQWIFEAGYVGALAMFAVIAQLLLILLGGLRRRRFGRTWIAGASAITAVVLTHGLIDFGLQVPAIAGFWALALGVGVGVSRPSRGRSASSSRPSISSQ